MFVLSEPARGRGAGQPPKGSAQRHFLIPREEREGRRKKEREWWFLRGRGGALAIKWAFIEKVAGKVDWL